MANICPAELKPLYYIRYVDDIFAVYSTKEQYIKLYNHIRVYHANIEFIVVKEHKGEIKFCIRSGC